MSDMKMTLLFDNAETFVKGIGNISLLSQNFTLMPMALVILGIFQSYDDRSVTIHEEICR